jgi:Na+-translocating ferredoxin:NAD+ oxidoreductase RnfC subunit
VVAENILVCALQTFERKSTVATLATLKLSTAVKPTHMPAVQVRRNKLAKRLWEQAELAKAQQAGTQFTATKFRTVVENDTGLRKQVEVNKRIKQWWFTTDSGKLALSVRYGARLLELAKGKFAVELASEKELVPTLEIIKAAVLNGELDAAIDTASNKLRDSFQR